MLETFVEKSPLEMAETLKEFREKIEHDGDLHPSKYLDTDVKLLYSIAHKHYFCDQFKEGEIFFLRLVLARPAEKIYWQGLASCRQMQKNFEGALVAWGMASCLDESDVSYLIFGAECLLHLNQKVEAKSALHFVSERIDKDHPNFTLYTKLNLALSGEE